MGEEDHPDSSSAGVGDEPFGSPVPDGDLDGELGGAAPPSSKVEAWRRRSATGAILTGIARGLQQVFEAPRNEPSIVVQTSGDPPDDLPVEADFEYRRPRESVVSIRPWLIPTDNKIDARSESDEDAATTGDGEPEQR